MSPKCRWCKKSFVSKELVLLLCLPSVDALIPKGICPNVVSVVQIPKELVVLLSASVYRFKESQREFRPKGISPVVVSQVSML